MFHTQPPLCIFRTFDIKILPAKHPNHRCIIKLAEAATGGVLQKKVFYEISQNSQENTCARVFLNKVAGLKDCNFIKKGTLAQVFSCEFCKISMKTFSTEHIQTTASELAIDKSICQQLSPFSAESSHQKCSVKNVFFKNFVNFTGKCLCWGLFLIKLQA